MLKLKDLSKLAFVALLTVAPLSAAQAAPIFVGSWQVDSGPDWLTNPLAYTGQEAAALLFGGSPSDYVISTVGPDASLIDNLAWYSVLGMGGGYKFAEDYSNKLAGGLYYDGGSYDYVMNNPASAYVWDNASGDSYINYAFRIEGDENPIGTPAPAGLGLLGLGFVSFGLYHRRRYSA